MQATGKAREADPVNQPRWPSRNGLSLTTGKVNVLFAFVAMTPERAKSVQYSKPYIRQQDQCPRRQGLVDKVRGRCRHAFGSR